MFKHIIYSVKTKIEVSICVDVGMGKLDKYLSGSKQPRKKSDRWNFMKNGIA